MNALLITVLLGTFPYNLHSMEYPKIAETLYRIETGNGKSKLYKTHNNCFGFKASKSTYQVGVTKHGYCIYANKTASVEDYRRFERRVINQGYNTEEKFLKYIFKHYAEIHDYRKRFMSVYKKL